MGKNEIGHEYYDTYKKDTKGGFSFKLLLIALEGVLSLLFPLFIGYAIDDALNNDYNGAIGLGTLRFATLIIGVVRRVFYSRFYAKIYQEVGANVLSNQEKCDTSKKVRPTRNDERVDRVPGILF